MYIYLYVVFSRHIIVATISLTKILVLFAWHKLSSFFLSLLYVYVCFLFSGAYFINSLWALEQPRK
jgi:hypothetical protein